VNNEGQTQKAQAIDPHRDDKGPLQHGLIQLLRLPVQQHENARCGDRQDTHQQEQEPLLKCTEQTQPLDHSGWAFHLVDR